MLEAIKQIQEAVNDSTKGLSTEDYVGVLEEIICDLEARLEAAKEELGD